MCFWLEIVSLSVISSPLLTLLPFSPLPSPSRNKQQSHQYDTGRASSVTALLHLGEPTSAGSHLGNFALAQTVAQTVAQTLAHTVAQTSAQTVAPKA